MTALVLVHGGSVTSTAWDPVLSHLRHPAHAPDLPGRRYRPADLGAIGRTDWEGSVVADIGHLGLDDVVLVGHSSGAYVIPGVAARLPEGTVRHLVYVAGTCPTEGQPPVDALAPRLRDMAAGNEAYLKESSAGRTLAGLRPGEPPIETVLEVVEVQPALGLEAPRQLFEPMTWVGVPDVPRTYVRALQDRVIPPDHALVMASNGMAGTTIDIDTPHDVAAAGPEELARILDGIAAR